MAVMYESLRIAVLLRDCKPLPNLRVPPLTLSARMKFLKMRVVVSGGPEICPTLQE